MLIDLVGYRRWGHNETDEPAFTQPTLYDAIRAHPTPRQVWGERLVREGVLAAGDVEEVRPSRVSLMPDGQLADLTARDAADLIAYLASLK